MFLKAIRKGCFFAYDEYNDYMDGGVMTQIVLLVFELIGTVAFAVSGAMTALKKQMDIFGIATLGLITAVGGGVIRDLVLGNTPPETFKNPIYGIVAIITSMIVFLPVFRKLNSEEHHNFDLMLLIMDSLGLAVFTVMGIGTAVTVTNDFNIYLLIFVGIVTGTGGGVIRDILAKNTPYIFVKHFYATASLIGAVVCIALWKWAGNIVAMIVGALTVFVLRILAARFRWELPK